MVTKILLEGQDNVLNECLLLLDGEVSYMLQHLIKNAKGLSCSCGLSFGTKPYYDWPIAFSEQQQNVLAYYRPFAGQIKSDIELGAHCLSSILKQSIKITQAAPFVEAANNNMLIVNTDGNYDTGFSWTGVPPVEALCFTIEIGPLQEQDIAGFLPGSPLRNFLDKGLCPLFLPDQCRWRVVLSAKEETFVYQNNNLSCYWGVSTRITGQQNQWQ